MTAYQITARGTPMGTYEAENEAEAMLAYIKDAGYQTLADAAEACGQPANRFIADLEVVEAAVAKGREKIAELAWADGEHTFAREVIAGCWDHRNDVAKAITEAKGA